MTIILCLNHDNKTVYLNTILKRQSKLHDTADYNILSLSQNTQKFLRRLLIPCVVNSVYEFLCAYK